MSGSMRRRLIRGCLGLLLVLLALVAAAVATIYFQGRETPQGRPEYVALGSSFAAGAGLGPLQENSPILCARSVNGYPQQLARTLKLSIVDMSCGGATTRHLLDGGQFFQGPQIRAITKETRLVTITVGGNDVGYIGDLSLLAARNSDTIFGWLVRQFWSGPKQPGERDFAGLKEELNATLRAIHQRAPGATIVVATYPAILPATGTCARIGLSEAEADLMRRAGDGLAAATKAATVQGGALVADMDKLGADHDACSAVPWVSGWKDAGVAPFHPTMSGAEATAAAVAATLKIHQQL
jgi:lysophospholipase L1-like esterase